MISLAETVDALITAIQAQAAAGCTPDLQVTFGPPGGDMKLEGIVVAETVEDLERTAASLGGPGIPGTTDEAYSVSVRVEVQRAGAGQRDAVGRAEELAEWVEAAVNATSSPPLGLQPLVSVQLRRIRVRNGPSADGRFTIYDLAVEVHARV